MLWWKDEEWWWVKKNVLRHICYRYMVAIGEALEERTCLMLILLLVMDAVAGWHISVVVYCCSCLLPYYCCSPISLVVCVGFHFPHVVLFFSCIVLMHAVLRCYCAFIEMRLLCWVASHLFCIFTLPLSLQYYQPPLLMCSFPSQWQGWKPLGTMLGIGL